MLDDCAASRRILCGIKLGSKASVYLAIPDDRLQSCSRSCWSFPKTTENEPARISVKAHTLRNIGYLEGLVWDGQLRLMIIPCSGYQLKEASLPDNH
jgi:hypothetical protein